jgi:hypothetical protein
MKKIYLNREKREARQRDAVTFFFIPINPSKRKKEHLSMTGHGKKQSEKNNKCSLQQLDVYLMDTIYNIKLHQVYFT